MVLRLLAMAVVVVVMMVVVAAEGDVEAGLTVVRAVEVLVSLSCSGLMHCGRCRCAPNRPLSVSLTCRLREYLFRVCKVDGIHANTIAGVLTRKPLTTPDVHVLDFFKPCRREKERKAGWQTDNKEE